MLPAADLGLLGRSDTEVMEAAAREQRVLVSADTDFGELLALGRRPGPSVILLRRISDLVEPQLNLLSNLGAMEDELTTGAIVVISAGGVRIGTCRSRVLAASSAKWPGRVPPRGVMVVPSPR